MSKLTSMPACFAMGESFITDFIFNNPVDGSAATELEDPSSELLDASISIDKVRDLASGFLDKRAAILGNQMNAPMQNAAAVDRIAQDYQKRAAAVIESGLQGIKREFDKLLDEMEPKELKPVMAAQILGALQNMRAEDRKKTLADMDDEIYSAIYHAHYIAASLTKSEKQIAVDNHQMKHFRRNRRRIERIGKIRDMFMAQIVPSSEKFFGEAVDQGELAAAKASAELAERATKIEEA